jgi:hypothetical protein
MASQRQPTKGLFDSTKPLKVPSDSRSTVIQLERTETNRSSKLSRTPSHLSQIPDSSAHLRAGCMQRRFMDTTIVGWSNESLVLTESKLFISKPACAGEEHGQGALDSIRIRVRPGLRVRATVPPRTCARVRLHICVQCEWKLSAAESVRQRENSQALERWGKSTMCGTHTRTRSSLCCVLCCALCYPVARTHVLTCER